MYKQSITTVTTYIYVTFHKFGSANCTYYIHKL